jgi:SAM-dependent methyltransferase
MPQAFIVDAVVREVRSLKGYPNLSILDLSCGEGEVLSRLAADGCRVHGTHFRADDYIIENRGRLGAFPITTGVDLQQRLPFEDGSFDVVLMTEVLEHLDSHFHVVAEVSRVVRRGGFFVFSTPNVQRLHSRLQFFLTGKHKLIRRRVGWDQNIGPVDFSLIHAVLGWEGFEILGLGLTQLKFKSVLLSPLWPLVWLACRLTVDKDARRNPVLQQTEKSLNRWLSDPAMLFSEQLLVVTRRSETIR